MRGTAWATNFFRLFVMGLLLVFCEEAAGGVEVSGQFSAWSTLRSGETEIGARYIPEFSLSGNLSGDWDIDAEVALDAWGFATQGGSYDDDADGSVDPYRLWMRFASPRFELRAGLQKISFGPAVLLRPLMWFDSLDPRDPLQLTDGVYGLLLRYYLPSNANFWMWGLYGNDDLRGWDVLPVDENEIEYGCRMQFPTRTGEIAFSYHHRRVDPDDIALAALFPGASGLGEDRFGLDGKWDVGAGLWFEAALIRREYAPAERRYRRFLSLGADYTFDVGNGLHLLGEHLITGEADSPLGSGGGDSLSALLCDYPLNIFDSVTAIVYYDWEGGDWSRFLRWQRTYDDWQIHVSAFWNPEIPPSEMSREELRGFSGRGIQLMLVFNH